MSLRMFAFNRFGVIFIGCLAHAESTCLQPLNTAVGVLYFDAVDAAVVRYIVKPAV